MFSTGSLLTVITEGTSDAVFVKDRDGRYQFANARTARVLGRSAAQIVGHTDSDFFPPPIAQSIQENDRRVMESGRAETVEEEVREDDGQVRVFEAVKTPYRDAAGNVVGLLGVARDITARVRAEQESARLLQEVQAGAARQRALLKDMLRSLTEGHLRLCDKAAELPAPLAPAGPPVALSKMTLRDLRRQISDVAGALGLPPERADDFLTAVGEASMNAVVHAPGSGAAGQVRAASQTGTVQVWITDHGPGIPEETLHRAVLERGYTTSGTFGHGFWMAVKTCDRIFLLTGPAGTTVVLEQERTPPPPDWLLDDRF